MKKMTKENARQELARVIEVMMDTKGLEPIHFTMIEEAQADLDNKKTALDDLTDHIELLTAHLVELGVDLATATVTDEKTTTENKKKVAEKKAEKKQGFKWVTVNDIKPEKITFAEIHKGDLIGIRYDKTVKANFAKRDIPYDCKNPELVPTFDNDIDMCEIIKKTTEKAKEQYLECKSIVTGAIFRYFPENFEDFIGDDNVAFRVYRQTAQATA